MIWLQVRDVRAEQERLAPAGARIVRGPAMEPWGLTEMWIEDPDGVPDRPGRGARRPPAAP